VCLCRYETIKKIEAHHEHKKTHDFFNKKGSFDKENLVALWAKIPTRLKQVKRDMFKQKTIIRLASSSHFGKSPIRLASPQQLLMGTKNCGRNSSSSKFMLPFTPLSRPSVLLDFPDILSLVYFWSTTSNMIRLRVRIHVRSVFECYPPCLD